MTRVRFFWLLDREACAGLEYLIVQYQVFFHAMTKAHVSSKCANTVHVQHTNGITSQMSSLS